MRTPQRVARFLYLGYTPVEIAAHLDLERRYVYNVIDKHRLPTNKLLVRQSRRLLTCLAEGGDLDELCAVFRVTPARVSRSLVCLPPSDSLSLRLLWLAWWRPCVSGPKLASLDGAD